MGWGWQGVWTPPLENYKWIMLFLKILVIRFCSYTVHLYYYTIAYLEKISLESFVSFSHFSRSIRNFLNFPDHVVIRVTIGYMYSTCSNEIMGRQQEIPLPVHESTNI